MNVRKLAFSVEEIIVTAVLLLNILAFADLLPDFLAWAKLIVSWTLFAFLLYRIGLSKLLFGQHSPGIDIFLICAYLLLQLKSLLHWAQMTQATNAFMSDFLGFLVQNHNSFTYISFLSGSLMILLIPLYISAKLDFRGPSVMEILHTTGHSRQAINYLTRYFKVLFVLLAFYIIVFNLLFEWLAIAIDAPIAMILLLLYVFWFIRHSRRFSAESAIFRIGSAGERFYEAMISHFRYRQTLLLGIAGMLVLHLLTDFASFILPFLFSVKDAFYHHAMTSHETIYSLIAAELQGISMLESAMVIAVYFLNIIGLVLLLAIPALIWYFIYSGRMFRVKRVYLVLFFASLPPLLASSTFSIEQIKIANVVGVNISFHAINAGIGLHWILLASALMGSVVWLLFISGQARKSLAILAVLLSQVFFAYYTCLFFISVLGYHMTMISLFLNTDVFMSCVFALLLLVQTFFYTGGFIFFQYEILRYLKRYVRF